MGRGGDLSSGFRAWLCRPAIEFPDRDAYYAAMKRFFSCRLAGRHWTVFLSILAAAALLLVAAGQYGRTAQEHPFFEGGGLRIIAHRGGIEQGPENTLAVFENSLSTGAQALEMDLRTSRDGALVLMHDAAVERTTDGRGLVSEMSLAQLKKLDAGYRWSLDGASFPFRGLGITIPTLAEVLDAFPHIPLVVEVKEDRPQISEPLCRLLEHQGHWAHVLVASFHPAVLSEVRSRCPQAATAAAPGEVLRFYLLSRLGLTAFFKPRMQALLVPHTYKGRPVATDRFVSAAHRRNLKVAVWTINERGSLETLIRAGVDGVLTDKPELLAAALR
jgi:glycerophosphoryl diester phosphodiesterase